MTMLELDATDRRLLEELMCNGRVSASDLAKIVGLTRQSVAERMERLRAEGVISGYTVAIAPERLGLAVRAYIAITMLPTCTEAAEREVIAMLERNPWVQECYRVTGEDYFQVRVIAPSIDALKDLVLELRATQVVQNTRTMLALETLFEKSAPGASVLAVIEE
jgi:Lrp/AsnC family transcriptional regulator, leucine-responsive regulatory protein